MNLSKVIFEFTDSSVPPPDHRSYTITIDKNTIHIIVDSYGTIINEQSFRNNIENFDNLSKIIKEANLRNVIKKGKGCTGGTTQAIKLISEDEKEIFSGYTYFCGRKEYGSMAGKIKDISQHIKNLIPDFSSVIE